MACIGLGNLGVGLDLVVLSILVRGSEDLVGVWRVARKHKERKEGMVVKYFR
jgi:hypothetical protein